jgi:hypothetical protein
VVEHFEVSGVLNSGQRHQYFGRTGFNARSPSVSCEVDRENEGSRAPDRASLTLALPSGPREGKDTVKGLFGARENFPIPVFSLKLN